MAGRRRSSGPARRSTCGGEGDRVMISDPLLVGLAYGAVLLVIGVVAQAIVQRIVAGSVSSWRALWAFALALAGAWLVGVLLSVLMYSFLGPMLQHAVSRDALGLPLVGKSFFFAALFSALALRNVKKSNYRKESAAEVGAVELPMEMRSMASVPIHLAPLSARSAAFSTADGVAEECWSAASAEFESSSRRPGLWAQVFSEAEGNEAVAKAKYLRYRALELGQKQGASHRQNRMDVGLSAGVVTKDQTEAKEPGDAGQAALPPWVTRMRSILDADASRANARSKGSE